MSIAEDIQKPAPGAKLYLYEIDFSTTGLDAIPPTMHLYSGVLVNYGTLYFGGLPYAPSPLTMDNVKATAEGPMPRPVVTLSNIGGGLSRQMVLYNDFIGAKVSRFTTFAQYLDGEPLSDPTARVTDTFFVEQKKSETNVQIELQLVNAVDAMDAMLPSRVMLSNTCLWLYKGENCTWPGTNPALYFDANDQSIGDPEQDVCSKSVTGCRRRFCTYSGGEYTTPHADLPYGGFPALGRTK